MSEEQCHLIHLTILILLLLTCLTLPTVSRQRVITVPCSLLARQVNPKLYLQQGFLMEMLYTWSKESKNAGC